LRDDLSWQGDVLALVDDTAPRVRFQAAIALGSARATAGVDDPIPAALARIAARDGHDRWLRAAVLSSLAGREGRFLAALRGLAGGTTALAPELLAEFGRMLPLSAPREEWPDLVRLIVGRDGPAGFPPAEQAALLTGLAGSARGKLVSAAGGDILTALAAGDAGLAASIREVVNAMASLATEPSAGIERRRAAVGLLGLAGFDRSGEVLLTLLEPSQPAPLQAAAVRALGTQRDPRVASALLASGRFAAYTPSVRDEALSALLAQSALVPGVLDAVADGRVPAGAIDAAHRRQLARHPDPAIRRRAESLFGAVAGDRAKVYDAYKDVVSLANDPARGRAVFRRECAQCHRLDQEGHAVGPDLFGIRNQPKESILLHILVPDHEITAGFAAYTVATRDGRVLTGLIASEMPSSLTLLQPLGKEETIPRDEIEELSAGKQSLMPQGLERSISRQEFADLLAYLKGEAAGSR
jgi:putative heme-binding domain-containing protein